MRSRNGCTTIHEKGVNYNDYYRGDCKFVNNISLGN